ncbi:MAG: hypothetical protein ABIL46_05790 [candidate division WOR-3 bacterium]
MKSIPKFIKKYFWEADLDKLDIKKYRIYILRRIMEYGDEKAVAWLWKNFKKSEMRKVLIESRGFSKKSANYWAVILDLPKEKMRCLNKQLQKKQRRIWPY